MMDDYLLSFSGENYDARKEAAVFGWDTLISMMLAGNRQWKYLEGTAFLGKITTEYSGEFDLTMKT